MSASDIEMGNDWLNDTRAGDFSTMPPTFAWDTSARFAHIIDGYSFAGGVVECMEITRSAISTEPDPKDPAVSAMLLWVALFGEHRACRHGGGYPPSPEKKLRLDSLCEALRGRLQALSLVDRDRLMAIVARHPWRD